MSAVYSEGGILEIPERKRVISNIPEGEQSADGYILSCTLPVKDFNKSLAINHSSLRFQTDILANPFE